MVRTHSQPLTFNRWCRDPMCSRHAPAPREQRLQFRLALLKQLATEIFTVQFEQIEGIEKDLIVVGLGVNIRVGCDLAIGCAFERPRRASNRVRGAGA